MGSGSGAALLALVFSAGLAAAQEPLFPPANPSMTTLAVPLELEEAPSISQPPSTSGRTSFDQVPVMNEPASIAEAVVRPAPAERVWLGAGYLLWWTRSAPNPNPLVTTGPFNPNTFTGSPIPAALGSPGTQVLFGGSDVNFHAQSGIRLEGGFRLDQDFAIEAGGFLLEQAANRFSVSSNAAGNPFLGFALHNAISGSEGVNAISFPSDAAQVYGGQSGAVNITSYSQLWGAEANFAYRLLDIPGLQLTGLVGFRYLDLNESMDINGNFTPLDVPIPLNSPLGTVNPGELVSMSDAFRTHNQFYGGQLGSRFEYIRGIFDLTLITKVALGANLEHLSISGASSVQGPGAAPVTVPGGIYTSSSNIGSYARDEFSIVPEIDLNLGIQITPWMRATIGYSFLYWTQVLRPGNTIDRTIDQVGIPTSPNYVNGVVGARPLPVFGQSDFWAQGVNFGLEFRY